MPCCHTFSQAQGVVYIADFLSQQEEAQLLAAVDAAPASRWTKAGERKMQNWGGRPSECLIREVNSINRIVCTSALSL